MHVVIVAGGELPAVGHAAVVTLIDQADLVIAADSGFDHCRSLDRWPALLVGDLDSVNQTGVGDAEAHGVEVVRFPADKDDTDLALAFRLALKHDASLITAVAVFGGRLDHELATIGMLASQEWAHVEVNATDGRRQMWVVRSSLELQQRVGSTLSIVPWGGQVTGVTTTGLQWPLDHDTLPMGTTRGVSNICALPTQTVAVAGGVALVVADVEQL